MLSYLSNYFTLRKSFVFYGSYHHDWRNQLVHMIFVPIIFTTALTFLSFVPLSKHLTLADIVALVYAVSFLVMEPLAALPYTACIALMHRFATHVGRRFLLRSLAAHVLGWTAQILAHRYLEKDKPAFMQDPLQAVHSAVFFVWLELLFRLGYKPREAHELNALVERSIAERHPPAKTEKKG